MNVLIVMAIGLVFIFGVFPLALMAYATVRDKRARHVHGSGTTTDGGSEAGSTVQ